MFLREDARGITHSACQGENVSRSRRGFDFLAPMTTAELARQGGNLSGVGLAASPSMNDVPYRA